MGPRCVKPLTYQLARSLPYIHQSFLVSQLNPLVLTCSKVFQHATGVLCSLSLSLSLSLSIEDIFPNEDIEYDQ